MHTKTPDGDIGASVPAARQPGSQEIDVPRIVSDTEQGFACHAVLPTYQELAALERRLRRHIRQLVPVVEAQAAAMDPAWMGHATRRSLLARAAQTLAQGPGDGLLSAAEHVCALARVCRALLGSCS
ncbi:DUF6415 family natural product biosynthesis protein [Streptomyces klenkii]|uniref:DUF6415 family natural product biosynthesis protein n=1 Tax=Streptomyces klenkii TaxID=1420899 RepID=UPI0033A94651